MSIFFIRPTKPSDAAGVAAYLDVRWGSPVMAAHDVLFHPANLPGFVAVNHDKWIGLLTYNIIGNACEIVTLNSDQSGLGVGSALIEATRETAVATGCLRLWLVTTNDNWPAFRFYQRRGFQIATVRPNAVKMSRTLKPEIPLIGVDGIPIRDEIEFEMDLSKERL